MSFLRAWSVLGLILVLTNIGICDLAPPENRPEPSDDPVVVKGKVVQGDVKDIHPNVEAKIVIPRHLLPQLQRTRKATGWSRTPVGGTIIAGLAMSAAAVSVMFLFKKSRRRHAGAACLIGCVILGGGYALWADVPVPGQSKSHRRPTFHSVDLPQIAIVIQDEGDEVVVILPKKD